MLKNYLKIGIRNLLRNKLYTFINILGLSLGITSCILIYLYIDNELSFDHFHKKKNQILRINKASYEESNHRVGQNNQEFTKSAWLPMPLGEALTREIPEIKHFTRFAHSQAIVQYKDKIFTENDIFLIDKGFFQMFSFPMLKGSAMKKTDEIILTPEIAQKYFGTDNPVGKILRVDFYGKEKLLTVSGVIARPPKNSSLEFKILTAIENHPFFEIHQNNWNNFNTPHFIELDKNATLNNFERKLAKFTDKYFGKKIEKTRKRLNLPKNQKVFALEYSHLTTIHLDNKVSWDNASNPLYLYILSGIAILILAIACINYMAITLSKSVARSREVGVRKVFGAISRQVLYQFWLETQIIVVLSCLGGLLFAEILLPFFNQMAKTELRIWQNYKLIFIALPMFSLLLSLFAGLYPAAYVSGFHPIKILRSRSTYKINPRFNQVIVVMQYSLAIFLLISSVIMFNQMNYITHKDLGYNQNQILVIHTSTYDPQVSDQIVKRFKAKIKDNPSVISASGTSLAFSQGWSRMGFKVDGKNFGAFCYRVDTDYLKTLEIQLIKGRNFSSQMPSDSTKAVLINETLAKELGWKEPIGKKLPWQDDEKIAPTVVGVVKDYHFLSIKEKIGPVFLYFNRDYDPFGNILVKIKPADMPNTIAFLTQDWKSVVPDKPFEFSFLDQDVNKQYEMYQKIMQLMSFATSFAILIACLGLFGLAGINTANKTKEIGIRKVLGASVNGLITWILRDFATLVLIACLIASPFAYYLMGKWLQDFAYRTTLSPWYFATAWALALLIAVLTVSFQAYKAASLNPVEVLKNE